MRLIGPVLLFLLIAMAETAMTETSITMLDGDWECDGAPTFRSPPPIPLIEREPDGSASIYVKYTHEDLDLHWMTFSVRLNSRENFGHMRVALPFQKEGEFGASSVKLDVENESVDFPHPGKIH